ncbi:MAG: 1-(5-phosphoribosyl)-5-[(5-phosphoribosylamino)methylideneamino]imidazole-4-carboxamide isomerase [Armatimonadota bacterium]|nr:1-(5-phosphoribosyl)-5-[(5-phosphoribosylamino)methylideneamino]imidazole-4-carboxamide isomerase [Armatimonadota bacterium]
MEIIPAIDIRGGQCVRLLQGDYAHETVYGADPVAMAQRWVAEGAPRLHIVDLDGAREGAPANLEIVARITQTVPVPVQLGGGLRTAGAIEKVLEAGVQRCIIGTKAAQQPEWAQQMFAQFGEAIILGLDARNGFVATSGWQETSQIPAVHFAQTMQEFGCARIIFTDIARDGTLAGPNAEALRAVAEAVEIPIIASGGVHKATDIRILKNIPNVDGAIVGKALYEGTTTLGKLLAIADEPQRRRDTEE